MARFTASHRPRRRLALFLRPHASGGSRSEDQWRERGGTRRTPRLRTRIRLRRAEVAAQSLPPADYKISDVMSSYWAHFVKSGDPNGTGLPHWPAYSSKDHYAAMHFGETIAAEPEMHRARYEFWSAYTPSSASPAAR